MQNNRSFCFCSGTLAEGALVKFQGSRGQEWFFFLGPLLSKPLVHVFVQAFPDSVAGSMHIHLLCKTRQVLRVWTSQQFFQKILESSGRLPLGRIAFKVMQYLVLPHRSMLCVQVNEAEGQSKSFEVTSENPRRRRTRTGTVAFGLKKAKETKETMPRG